MKALDALDQAVTQAEFAQIIGVSEARVSQLVAEGWLVRGETAHNMLLAYCERLRDVAAGRASGESGGLDLVQERARLAKLQGDGVEIKNAVLRGQFAPIGLLSEVLADASQGVVERFEQLPGQLRKACPELPAAALDQIMATISAARNEWVRATSELARKKLESLDDDEVDQVVEEGSM